MKSRIFYLNLIIFFICSLTAFTQSSSGNNTAGASKYLGFSTNQDLEFNINGNEHMRLLHTSGRLGINLTAPARRLHVHGTSEEEVEGVLITNDATGSTATDGLLLGTIGDNNLGLISWGENSDLRIQQGGHNRIRFNRYTYNAYNAVDTQTGVSRILLPLGGTAPGGGLSNTHGYSLLHMGTTSGPGGSDETSTLRRPWLNIGTTYTGGADIFYCGLLQSPKPESTEHHVDAVLAWGCNETNDDNAGPDYFRILFYKPTDASPSTDANQDQGRECVRITPFGNMGVGDFSHMTSGLDIDPLMRLHVSGGILATGNVGANPNLGAGRRLMWIPEDAAFRAGEVTGGQWASTNVGFGSFAAGRDVLASGDWSFALGEESTTSGAGSASFGFGNTVSGDYSMAFGKSQVVTGELATGIGCLTSTTADGSITIGRGFGALSPLLNNIDKSIMLGMNSDVPTMFIGDSGGTGLWSNVGFGNITAPTHLIDANGNARFRQMPEGAGTVLVTGVEEDAAGDYSLSYLEFSADGDEYLGGDGAWHDAAPCTFNLISGGSLAMGYSGACNEKNVGIGTNSPGTKLDVSGTLTTSNSTLRVQSSGSGSIANTGLQSRAMGGTSSVTGASGSATATANGSGGSLFGMVAGASSNNGGSDYSGYTVYGLYATTTGTASTAYWAGYFNGDVYGSDFIEPSDEMLKSNIQDAGNSLDQLLLLNPKLYNFNHNAYPGMNLPQGQRCGIMADDMAQHFPSLVKNVEQPATFDEEGNIVHEAVNFTGVNYVGLVPHVVDAVQELKAIIDAQQAQIEALTALVASCCAADSDKSMNQGSGSTGSPTEPADFDLQIEKATLDQNVPNPFQNETSITYRIPTQAQVRVRILGQNGQQIDTLVDGLMPKGEYKIIWNASHLPAGMYYYTLEADGIELVKKAVKL